MVIDSTIVKYIAYSNKELGFPMYVSIFVTFAFLFVGTVVVMLGFINRVDQDSALRRGFAVKSSYIIMALTQFSLFGIIVLVIQATISLKSYSILLLLAVIYISHITSFFFLIILVISFVVWIKTKHSKILSLYTISFSLIGLAIITSLVYATISLSYQKPNIKPYPIHLSLLNLPSSGLANSFGFTLDILSILSFVSIWLASAMLLSTYSRRIGKIRFWAFISIPLIYFLFPFEGYLLNITQSLVVSYPVFFGIVNVLIFSATKQTGALFFSLAFLAAAVLVGKHTMQKYMLISAIGIAILFGCIEIESLLYATYPPFGLITISFMPIGSYLIFTGILRSAKVVSQDKELRREFHNTAMSQLSLLKTIGVTEMENQLLKSYKSVNKRARSLKKDGHLKDDLSDDTHGFIDEMDKEKLREMVHDVLAELYSKPKSNRQL